MNEHAAHYAEGYTLPSCGECRKAVSGPQMETWRETAIRTGKMCDDERTRAERAEGEAARLRSAMVEALHDSDFAGDILRAALAPQERPHEA